MDRFTSYNMHHSAWGAYSSFILGEIDKGGGFALSGVENPGNNVYIGYRTVREGMRMLPFCHLQTDGFETQFGLEAQTDPFWTETVSFFQESEITRTLGMASDTFRAGRLTFSIYTPFGPVPAWEGPEGYRSYCVPGVLAQLTLDNRDGGEEALLYFGMSALYRLIGDFSQTLAGGASVGSYGFAVRKGAAREDIGFNPLRYVEKGMNENYRLGREVLVKTPVAPGEIKTLTIALATYQQGIVTSGLPCRFAYTACFEKLEDVLEYLLDNQEELIARARRRDAELEAAQGMSDARKQLLALAVHSYHASSELLLREDDGRPLWVVNEGEYRMMNTLDLTMDHLFFELRYHPWTMKNALEFSWEKYAYREDVTDLDGKVYLGGVSFTHDCGVGNMFAAFGTSAYEFEHVGTFSYMTMEELLNWTLCACLYVVKTGDISWSSSIREKLRECLQSIVNRDRNDDGVMDCDCIRCVGAREITTYDSIDSSLSQARNNLYMAVKTFGTYLSLAEAFRLLADEAPAALCEEKAKKAAETVAGHFLPEEGYIPSIFEGQDVSMIIPAIEGLLYPLYLGRRDIIGREGPYGELYDRLERHLHTVLQEGRCLVPGTRGWKLSSNNDNSWLSKIFLCQYVAETLFGLPADKQSDETHLRWELQGCASLCAVDQVNCIKESVIASRLYPRLVTAILFFGDE